MPRTSYRTAIPPHYVTSAVGNQLIDRLNGYVLSVHPDPDAVAGLARQLNTDPAAAIAAVRALDDAQCGPAEDVRRTLRRWGYNWSLEQREAIALHAYHELTELTAAGHLVMVWSRQGLPFYTTPERYRELSITFQYDSGEMIPTAPASELARRRERREAMPRRLRDERCELHGIATYRCLICGPVEEWECDWAACRANAVTIGAGRRVCERCAPALFSVSGIRLPQS